MAIYKHYNLLGIYKFNWKIVEKSTYLQPLLNEFLVNMEITAGQHKSVKILQVYTPFFLKIM